MQTVTKRPIAKQPIVLLALGAAAVCVACSPEFGSAQAQTRPAPAPAVAPLTQGTVLPDFAGLVERCGPAVVNISVIQKQRQVADGPGGLSPQDPFYEFFRRFGVPNGMPRGNPAPARGEGSGFIVSPDGYILTNTHVVDKADEVTVKLTDRREFTAKVIGTDERTDVAVIKIDARNLPTVALGDASKLRPGEWVVAIGAPFGFENSVTAGIVSATARSMPDNSNYTPFIQTDVAINPGNSGGPLFNLRGEVVGINSQIYSQSGGYMGLSFAIPIDIAANVKNQLIATGTVSRGKIGVRIQEIDAKLAGSFGLDRPQGALISDVDADTPAAAAGLKSGDIIMKVDGHPIETSAQVPALISNARAGSTVKLDIWRDRHMMVIPVRVVALEEPKARKASFRPGGEEDASTQLGLSLRVLTLDERREVKTEGRLYVEEVAEPAASAGIQPGDIILGVNGKKVDSIEDLRASVKRGATVALLIQRNDQQQFFAIHVG